MYMIALAKDDAVLFSVKLWSLATVVASPSAADKSVLRH
jgi:hypothetical protein